MESIAVQEKKKRMATSLRMLRAEAGMTMRQVADIAGISQQAISKWERGQCSPTMDKVWLLADVYKVPVAVVMGKTKTVRSEIMPEDEAGDLIEDKAAEPERKAVGA